MVDDLAKARRFAALWNKQPSRPGDFEVVEVTSWKEAPETDGEFLGYDLSAGYNNSLLRTGLKPVVKPSDISDSIWRQCYAHRLNDADLFQTSQQASQCLEAMAKIQDVYPGFFEGGDLRIFEVTGLYLVS